MTWTICLAVALAGFADDAESDRAKIRDAVVMNQQYLDMIHTIEAEIETWRSKDGGKNWDLISRENWLKDGPRERLRELVSHVGQGSDSESATIGNDTYYGDDETRILGRWNWEKPPATKPDATNVYHGAKGTLGKKSPRNNISGGPAYSMMLSANMQRYLPDLVKVSNPELIKEGPGVAQASMIGIRCVEPTNKWVFSIFLDRSKGYMIGRREVVVPQAKGVPNLSRAIQEVVETSEAQPGLFIPTRVRFTMVEDPVTVVESRVKKLVVNKPIDNSRLFLQFPEGMKVFDSRANVYHLWGVERPRQTFSELGMQSYDRKHAMGNERRLQGRGALWVFVALNALAVLICIGLIRYRRSLRSRSAGAA